jgi:hypothetical protein
MVVSGVSNKFPTHHPTIRLLNLPLQFIIEKVLLLVQPAGHETHLAGIPDAKLIKEWQLRIFIFLDDLTDLFPTSVNWQQHCLPGKAIDLTIHQKIWECCAHHCCTRYGMLCTLQIQKRPIGIKPNEIDK